MLKKIKQAFLICGILVLLIVVFVSAYQAIKICKEYIVGKNAYEYAQKYITVTSNITEDTEESKNVFPTVDFDGLASINRDICAWIRIDDTNIDYPVVQGDDNSFYLKHLINRKWNSNGSIFLDCFVQNDFTDKHSVLYGHHMKNGTMFSDITKYKNQDFFDNHTYGLLITSTKKYKIYFFSGYVADVNDAAWQLSFNSNEKFLEWIYDALEKSTFISEFKPALSDQIITLSTCSYEFENARYVLHGVLCPI